MQVVNSLTALRKKYLFDKILRKFGRKKLIPEKVCERFRANAEIRQQNVIKILIIASGHES